MTDRPFCLHASPSAAARFTTGVDWLLAHGPTAEVLVVGHTIDAARELCHTAVEQVGASFGWYRTSFRGLTRELAPTATDMPPGSPIDGVGADAVTARVTHQLVAEGGLGRYEHVAAAPGFVRALSRSLSELRLSVADSDSLEAVDPDLEGILQRFSDRLEESELSDRAGLIRSAIGAMGREDGAHPWIGLPVLLLDLPIENELEARLARELVRRADSALITVPAGDARTLAVWKQLTDATSTDSEAVGSDADSSLGRLQSHLFEGVEFPLKRLDETVTLFSAPGEGRECVEIARELLRAANDGIRFDQAAVLFRSPTEYRPHLKEALDRAQIPSYFAHGARRPDPAGRAFLALLRCRLERFSAVRFAEYLSIGQVPGVRVDGAPSESGPGAGRWVPPDELPPERYEVAEGVSSRDLGDLAATDADSPVLGGALRVPRRWEKLLVEAAVVGGIDRWRTRLDGLHAELTQRVDALASEDDPATERFEIQLRDLGHLREYALPLLEELNRWPAEATWAEWLDLLGALAARALANPDRVLELLTRLAPLGPVGPVGLDEVTRVLRPHLLEITRPPEGNRYGKVFVGTIDEARGRSFDLVFVPGLADHLFPRPVRQEAILSDTKREAINEASNGSGAESRGGANGRPRLSLPTTTDRVANEQLLLRLAVGAASKRVVLSFPRMDLARSRPRVQSFYALEAVRAAEGELPLMDALADRASAVTQARVGWPAPDDPNQAIDEAEYDLAELGRLFRAEEAETGAAHYLLNVNPFLRRHLRGRLRRWHTGWTYADGLLDPSDPARAALADSHPDVHAFSATALQALSTCPYKFYLYAVLRLRPRDEPGPIEEMDPLQKGGLVHEIQFRTGLALRDAGLLPVTPANQAGALEILDKALEEVTATYRDEWVPAIPRVWEDEVARIRSDLRRWIREAAREEEWVPWKFELAFGLGAADAGGEEERDPDSRAEPVALDAGIRLRGKIDLVEMRGSGGGYESATGAAAGRALRVTDHKTGRAWHARARDGIVIAGGEALQPVLYALAAEKLWPEAKVAGGGLYYCTSDGGFERADVPLNDEARRAADALSGALRTAFDDPAFKGPAFAAKPKSTWTGRSMCEWCDFRPICGPRELARTGRKRRPIQWLEALRAER
jgi:hypothetical protein